MKPTQLVVEIEPTGPSACVHGVSLEGLVDDRGACGIMCYKVDCE